MRNLHLNIELKCQYISNYFYDYCRKKELQIFRRTAKIGGCSLGTVQNIQGLKEAYLKHKNKESITFVTDGGVENINTTVKEFLATTGQDIKQLIAQKDIHSPILK